MKKSLIITLCVIGAVVLLLVGWFVSTNNSLIDMEETVVYEITGTTEANVMENKISNESPVGKALLKRQVGDVVTVPAPDGNYQLRIDEIA